MSEQSPVVIPEDECLLRNGQLCSVDESAISPEGISISPVLIDDYYVHRNKKITVGRAFHKYLHEYLLSRKFVNFDLNQGLDTCDLKPVELGLYLIMQYIEWKAAQIDCYDLKVITKNADFICRRGTINKLALSPYSEQGCGWKFVIEKFENIFFLSEIETEDHIDRSKNMGPEERLTTYWGHKFENLVFARKGKKLNPREPVSTWEDMYATFATTFQQTATEPGLKLFYTGEMDGLDSQGNHVQVKTQAYKLFKNVYFPEKAMRWWIQNKIVGIDDIVVGYRSKDGILFKVAKVSLDYLDKKCPQWDGNVCFGAAQRVLNNVRQIYDELVQPGELLLIEKKSKEKLATYSIVPASYGQVLTPEFKAKFRNEE